MSNWTAEHEYDKLVRHHRQVLASACAALVMAFVLKEGPEGRVSVRGLSQHPLPQTCFSRAWLGLKCPGCGLTRSIIHLAEGNCSASWRAHRLGGLTLALIALQIPYRIVALRRPDRRYIESRWLALLAYAFIALLLGNWLVELAAGRVTTV